MADLADVERMVDDWERDAVAKSQRYQVRDAAAAYQAQDDATAERRPARPVPVRGG